MATKPSTPTLLRTPKTVEAALDWAERELVRPPSGAVETVQLRPPQIKTRPELFQPRTFARTDGLNQKHVTKLAKRIGVKGELDPPLVLKLGKIWVCIDGHHRVAAYIKQGWGGEQIKCEWFPGSVHEAVDKSLKNNEVIKLVMKKGDRYEAAWQRVVLGWGSKKEINQLTGASDGLIAMMRRVKATHEDKSGDAFANEFRQKLGMPLKDASWSLARGVYLNLSPAQYDEQKEAAKLASYMRSRLEDRLSKNPKITAMAADLTVGRVC